MGCQLTILSEESPWCGQSGQARRVFWQEKSAWVLVQVPGSGIVAVPWHWTNLPTPQASDDSSPEEVATALITPTALRDLIRFVRERYTERPGR